MPQALNDSAHLSPCQHAPLSPYSVLGAPMWQKGEE